MFMHFINSLNWVDILILAFAIRIIYIGMQTGAFTELFKTLGLVLALFLSFQYYILVGGMIKVYGKIPDEYYFVFGFLLIWIIITVIFKFLRQGFFTLFTVQTISVLDKWGGAILAVGRFVLTASMVMYVLLVTGDNYLQTKTAEAFSRKYLVNVAPGFYKALSERFVSRLIPVVKYNSAVRETMKDLK
jgi:uncharacterized membrane protein required for colicin V production